MPVAPPPEVEIGTYWNVNDVPSMALTAARLVEIGTYWNVNVFLPPHEYFSHALK